MVVLVHDNPLKNIPFVYGYIHSKFFSPDPLSDTPIWFTQLNQNKELFQHYFTLKINNKI